jgi:hypothetical protein
MEFERQLAPEDLAMLELEPVRQPALKRMRDSHHALARVMATGMTNVEASAITGFDSTYISILKDDPSFNELLAFYAEHEAAQQADLRERMVVMALDVGQELRDRVLHTPENIEFNDLRNLFKDLADRTGHGPSQTVNANLNIADEMTYMQQRRLLEVLNAIESRESRDGSGETDADATSVIEGEAVGFSREAEDILPVPGDGTASSG